VAAAGHDEPEDERRKMTGEEKTDCVLEKGIA
jgi:hypothetical protein